jgi:dolichol kinase
MADLLPHDEPDGTRLPATISLAEPEDAVELPPVPVRRPLNLTRNVYHALNAVAVVLLVELLLTTPALRFGVAGAGLVAAWSMELARRVDPRINAGLMRLFARVAHPHEAVQVNSATWYTTAIFVLAVVFPVPAAAAGLMVLGFGDPMAALVGQRFGRHPLLGGRTLEGSIAFVVAGLVPAWAALALWHFDPLTALVMAAAAAVGGALGELVAGRIDDNLMIPLCGAASALGAQALLGAGT